MTERCRSSEKFQRLIVDWVRDKKEAITNVITIGQAFGEESETVYKSL
jgi:hypothetical protein